MDTVSKKGEKQREISKKQREKREGFFDGNCGIRQDRTGNDTKYRENKTKMLKK